MRRPQGYAITTEPGKATIERDTFTCAHCNGIVTVEPMQDPSEMGGFCQMCMSHTCKRCNSRGTCTPFEKRLERMERSDRLMRAVRGG